MFLGIFWGRVPNHVVITQTVFRRVQDAIRLQNSVGSGGTRSDIGYPHRKVGVIAPVL